MAEIDIGHIYSLYSRRLHTIAYSVLKDHFLAEDVVQETFLKAYKNIDSVCDQQKLAAWLAQIAVRTAIDFLRAEKRKNWLPSDQSMIEAILFESNSQDLTEKEVEHNFFQKVLNDSMGQLKKEYKEVLVLQLQYGLKEKEIACQLQLRSSTIKNRLYRARKQLRAALFNKFSA